MSDNDFATVDVCWEGWVVEVMEEGGKGVMEEGWGGEVMVEREEM